MEYKARIPIIQSLNDFLNSISQLVLECCKIATAVVCGIVFYRTKMVRVRLD
jgi:hypothetical protein